MVRWLSLTDSVKWHKGIVSYSQTENSEHISFSQAIEYKLRYWVEVICLISMIQKGILSQPHRSASVSQADYRKEMYAVTIQWMILILHLCGKYCELFI